MDIMFRNIQEQAIREFGLENPYTILICEVVDMWEKNKLEISETMRLAQCIYNLGQKNKMKED
jgi:hypothetical protein